jgi:hypothetical protein
LKPHTDFRTSRLLRGASTFIVVLLLAVVGGCGSDPTSASGDGAPPSRPAATPWTSGVFLGGATTLAAVTAFGDWRGRPTASLSLQSGFKKWSDIVSSLGLLESLRGFQGQVVTTVPLLPDDGTSTLEDVAAGRYDDVFTQVAHELTVTGRGDAVVRVGPTANVPSMPWAANVDNAPSYRAAARHVMSLLKQQVPSLRTEWDIGCGRGLEGTIDRTAALTRLYPGDDVTDVIGCVHFDAFGVRAVPASEWNQALRLLSGVGLDDVADFARQRGKQLAIPDWGLDNQAAGGGDDPTFITRMHEYFTANADILAFENYYNDPLPPRQSAIWNGPDATRNPLSAAEYRRLWALG